MNLLKTIFLGLIQGLTEFLPISSSGHLVLAKHFLGFEAGMSYDIFLHLGSLVAVLIYFRKVIGELLSAILLAILVYIKCFHLLFIRPIAYYNVSLEMWNDPKDGDGYKKCVWLLLATIVTGAIGYVFKDSVALLNSKPLLVCMWLCITGALLIFSDSLRDTNIDIINLGWQKSVFIGLGQAVAIIPGLSRSGTTITCSLMANLKRSEAATFSFLLSVPVILGANLSELKTLAHLEKGQLLYYFVGFSVACVSGYLVIRWLMKLIEKAKLRYFAYYCFAISIISIGLLYYGR